MSAVKDMPIVAELSSRELPYFNKGSRQKKGASPFCIAKSLILNVLVCWRGVVNH